MAIVLGGGLPLLLDSARAHAEQRLVAEKHPEILILYSARPGMPITDSIQTAIMETLRARGFDSGKIFSEYLDLARSMDAQQRDDLLALLRDKFAGKRFGLIIVVHRRAFEFFARDGADLFPDVPAVVWAGNQLEETPFSRQSLRIMEQASPRTTIDTALRLFPDSRRLLVVIGADEPLQPYRKDLLSLIGELPATLTVEFTADKTYEAMLARVADLPRDSLVFFGDYWMDARGRRVTPIEAARQVAMAANVPAFALTWSEHVAQGFLGGHVVDVVSTARLVGNLAADYLEGQALPPAVSPAISTDVFDWRQMRRWDVHPRDLPRNANIISRPPSLWKEYTDELLIGTLVAVLSGAVLIRSGKRHAQATAQASESRAPATADEVRERAEQLEMVNRQLTKLSFVDELTGLANRRRLDEVLTHESQRANRSGEPLSLIMIDVDHFKAFNDTYGHLDGDDCLRTIGRILANVLQRPADLASRFGGEEFLLVLPETAHYGALELANTLHAAIAKCAIPHSMSKTAKHLTCSSGVLTTRAPPPRLPGELLALVDEQLYRAKADGRDRICALDLSTPADEQSVV